MYSLPTARSIVWQGNVGVKGDIPTTFSGTVVTLTANGSDDTLQIQNAVNGTAPVIQLNAGTFYVSSMITVHRNVVIRGAGKGTTKIVGKSGFSGNHIFEVSPNTWSWNMGTPAAVNLQSWTKGSSTITTAAAHSCVVDDLVLIDQLIGTTSSNPPQEVRNSSWYHAGRDQSTVDRPIGQLARVQSVSGNTITLETPVYWTYDASLSPQLVRIQQGWTLQFGIQSLTIDNTLSSTPESIINLMNCVDSWLYDVELRGSYKALLRLWSVYRLTVRNCDLHDPIPPDASVGASFAQSRGYGIWANPWCSASLFENNIFYNLALGLAFNSLCSGNVISYNYIHNLKHGSIDKSGAAIAFHGAHAMMNLMEGNICQGSLWADDYFGSSSHNTFFRNRVINESGYNDGQWCIQLLDLQTNYNVIGNVLGTLGVETQYDHTVGAWGVTAVYHLQNSGVSSTILRHANWDSINNSTVYKSGEDQTLPASLYLTAKPAWMGTGVNWPAIGPDVYPTSPTVSNWFDNTLRPFAVTAQIATTRNRIRYSKEGGLTYTSGTASIPTQLTSTNIALLDSIPENTSGVNITGSAPTVVARIATMATISKLGYKLTSNNGTVSSVSIHISNDSTNGYDGTWTSISGTPAVPIVGTYMTHNFTGVNATWVRLRLNMTASATVAFGAMHLFGGYITTRFELWDGTHTNRVLSGSNDYPQDFGVVTAGTDTHKTMDVAIKNTDGVSHSYSVNVSAFKYGGDSFVSGAIKVSLNGGTTHSSLPLTISNIPSGGYSQTITLCCEVTGSSNPAQGTYYFSFDVTEL